MLSAIAIGSLTAANILADRNSVLNGRKDVLSGHSRLIVAHGEAALGDAVKIVAAVEPLLLDWDFTDASIGQEISARFQRLLVGSGHLSSAWVLDETGRNVVDNWSFPARPVNGADRIYFRTQKQGWDGPLVVADPNPGSITGRLRFTYSKAQRRPDGSLKSLAVVGIYNDAFSELYRETTRWDEASAGFFDAKGQPLALDTPANAPLSELARTIVAQHPLGRNGTGTISADGRSFAASWIYSKTYPGLFAVTAQPLDAALAEWRQRSLLTTAIALVLIAGVAAFALLSARIENARKKAQLNDLAMREVHHRVKNGLQLMISMIQMRARGQDSHAIKDLLREVTAQIQAVAQVHDLLQNAGRAESIDVNALLNSLCAWLRASWHGKIACELGDNVILDSDTGSTLAVVLNELLTNGLKYAQQRVTVKSEVRLQHLLVTVSNDGPALPVDFKLSATRRFGLRTAMALCSQIGGSLHAIEGMTEGAAFRISLPLQRAAAANAQAAE